MKKLWISGSIQFHQFKMSILQYKAINMPISQMNRNSHTFAFCTLLLSVIWFLLVKVFRDAFIAGSFPLLSSFSQWFWEDSYWHPAHLTWKNTDPLPWSADGVYYPRAIDSLWSLSVALILLSLRCLFTIHIANPIGRAINLREKKKKVVAHPGLEAFYTRSSRKPRSEDVKEVANQVGLTEKEVWRWLRLRKNWDKPSELEKWSETSYKFMHYFTMFWCGLWVITSKEWFHDDTPHHEHILVYREIHVMEWDLFWYYQLELGFYWSLFISQFLDVKRKDFLAMLLHHVLTITLLSSSMSTGWHRIGAIVALTHDLADWNLELAKLTHYAGYDKISQGVISLLLITWPGSRLVYLPFYVISMTLVDNYALDGPDIWGYFYVANACLLALIPLHVLWFSYLLTTVLEVLKGKPPSDSRSDSSDVEYSTDPVLDNNFHKGEYILDSNSNIKKDI